ncbi:MAG: phosphoribosylglycinamide formyltransferase [Cellvibrionaceae bacterium]
MPQGHSSPHSCKVVVLISGSGSNLQALIDAQKAGALPIDIVGVISNRPDVLGLERARNANIPTSLLDHKTFNNRQDFDHALAKLIEQYQPDLLVLAGFMRILTPEFTQQYQGKMLNIHPSLLPKYQGLHTHQRALEAGDDKHGVTVHFVTAELDGGPSIVQAIVAIAPSDDETSLAKKVQAQEHVIYPMAVKWFAEGRLQMVSNKTILDGEPLPQNGYQVDAR